MMPALFSPLRHKAKNLFCNIRACFLAYEIQGESKNADK